MRKIEFCRHNLEEEDIALATEVLRSTFLTTGPRVAAFEKALALYLGVTDVVGVTSCTGAMHLCLLRHGIGAGDEVITTPMTFVATTLAIMEAGATPVFVDVDPATGMITPGAVEAAVTPRTRGILPVHLYGRMADVRGLAKVAEKHGLALIEDAAHCVEGLRDDVRPGQLSRAACFSFYATKNMTSGEGGAIACMSAEDAAWYRSARHHGISKNASMRYAQKYQHWDMEQMGWKYNMDDIQAALLINQIKRLDANRARRAALVAQYRRKLSALEGLTFIEGPTTEQEHSANHLFTVLLPPEADRDGVLHRMHERGVGCAVNYRAVHVLDYISRTFGHRPEAFPVALEMGERTITLPLYPKLMEDEVNVVCETLSECLWG